MSFRPFKIANLGYWLIFLLLVMVGWLELATPFLAVFFSYFALDKLRVVRIKWVAVVLFCVMVLSVFYLFVYMPFRSRSRVGFRKMLIATTSPIIRNAVSFVAILAKLPR